MLTVAPKGKKITFTFVTCNFCFVVVKSNSKSLPGLKAREKAQLLGVMFCVQQKLEELLLDGYTCLQVNLQKYFHVFTAARQRISKTR